MKDKEFDPVLISELILNKKHKDVLLEGAKELFNLYEIYVEAGFSEHQALYIIVGLIKWQN